MLEIRDDAWSRAELATGPDVVRLVRRDPRRAPDDVGAPPAQEGKADEADDRGDGTEPAHPGREGYFTLVPDGTEGSTVRSEGSPVPGSEAARIIPFDSIPISLAGARFATKTNFLPTSCSAV